jgi:hypothetical protein
MTKLFSVTAMTLAAAGLFLFAPTPATAQVPVGVQVRVGPLGVSAGTLPYPVYSYPVYVPPPVYQPVYPPPAPVVVVRPAPLYLPYYRHHRHHGWRY